MISKLCRSGCISNGIKIFIKYPQVTSSFNLYSNNSVLFHKAGIHTNGNNSEENSESISSAMNDLWIPEIPMIDQAQVLNVISEPSFASLGLNNYTPPGLIQYILENVHVHLSLPWWACIGITAILLRSAMLPVMLNQRRVLVKYQNSMASLTNIMVEAMKAKETGNSIQMMIKMKEFSNFVQNQSMSVLTLMRPILIQAPVFISVFMALRGMAEAPVASLATGGLYWFTDLTVYDPYYVLPLITMLSLAVVIETGAEAPGPQGQTMKWVFRCVPAITFLIICHFPSTLLLYWTCSNIFSVSFAFLMKIPEFQKLLNIPDIVPMNVDNKNNYGIKEAMELMRSLQEVEARHRAEELRWQKEGQKEVLARGVAAAQERMRQKREDQA